jgi:multiple sugar transport system ATP-binding protein
MGAEIYLYIKIGEQNAIAKVSSRSQARAGDKIQVAIEAGRIHLFDKETQRYIIH